MVEDEVNSIRLSRQACCCKLLGASVMSSGCYRGLLPTRIVAVDRVGAVVQYEHRCFEAHVELKWDVEGQPELYNVATSSANPALLTRVRVWVCQEARDGEGERANAPARSKLSGGPTLRRSEAGTSHSFTCNTYSCRFQLEQSASIARRCS